MGNQESVPNYNETKRVMKVKKPPLKKKPTSKLVQVHQEVKIKPRVEANKRFIVEKPMEQNYEIKSKNREINSKLMERSMIQNKKTIDHQGQFLERPINSNLTMSNPKPNFDNIQFNPDNFQDQVKNYRNNMDDEKYQFEENLKNEKDIFYKKQREKEEKLNKSIKEFEDNYDPWNILGIEHGLMDISLIKKAYRKKALQYHPDKAGPKYEHIFNIVNQSYIYLLHKAEEEEEIEIKTTKEVTKQDYESFQDGMVNMHLDKDNFNINKFNEIFDKFRVGDENDDGYNDLLKDETNEQPLFNSKVSNEIFNAHFKKLKEKQSTALVAFDEPDSVNAVGSFQAGSLGASYQDGFGSSQSSNLGFTDIKQAYFDENLLIDPDKVNRKNYNSIDEYEAERSRLRRTPNEDEKIKYIRIEERKKLKEQQRIEILKEQDEKYRKNYSKINKKLINIK